MEDILIEKQCVRQFETRNCVVGSELAGTGGQHRCLGWIVAVLSFIVYR
jgi:hypothetical protein